MMKVSPACSFFTRLRQVPAEASVEKRRRFGEVRLAVSGGAEGAEQQGGVTHGGHALAAHVTDVQPGTGVSAHGRIQITTDLGLGLGSEREVGDAQRSDVLGQRPQNDPLGGLRHVPDLVQLPGAALSQHAEDHDAQADADEGADLRPVVRRDQLVAVAQHRDDHLGRNGDGGNESGQPGAAERNGDRGGSDQQRTEVDVRRRKDVDDDDRRNPRERDSHHRITRTQ
ncbi:hypothetical protein [Streptomyces inhibens]|uniref:hypothetical protein n=1 Tax=Streptomyces inhibens TaxID=2293571 RepID=UPI003CCA3A97